MNATIIARAAPKEHHPMGHSDIELAVEFGDKMRHAQAYLRSEMRRLGLFEEDGWKIIQDTRERSTGTEMVLRPFHLKLDAPEGLECVVWISPEQPEVDSECAPPSGEAESRLLRAQPR
jgi:hypothetical protein